FWHCPKSTQNPKSHRDDMSTEKNNRIWKNPGRVTRCNFPHAPAASPFDIYHPENPDADKETRYCPPAQAMLTSCRSGTYFWHCPKSTQKL
ncbi:MAG TPA: hypothetical protein PLK16_12775, partial [Saprospiraceae bacterium]|nr:hypothetical protein [Saprospiraceae bacterium]